jgi:Outer membrane protein beta-barrel domain
MKTMPIGLLCAGILAGSLADAQALKSYAGLKGGINNADITGANGQQDLSARVRFIGGAFYGIDFTDDFGMRIDGLYVQKGAEGNFTVPTGEPANRILSLDYLEFPLLFMVSFPTSKKVEVNLFAGPTFGFNVSAKVEIVDTGEIRDYNAETFEFGAAFGGGVEYLFSSMSIIGDFRYALSATSITDASDGKNSGGSIMVGVQVPLTSR